MAATKRRLGGDIAHLSFPGEDAAYRAARNALLAGEISLRRQVERVAARRRALPPGGVVPQDDVFQGSAPDGRPVPVGLSELFAPAKNTLVL
jgi:predicted dithiol-disulfide oxidoreductase (DUF899 family)